MKYPIASRFQNEVRSLASIIGIADNGDVQILFDGCTAPVFITAPAVEKSFLSGEWKFELDEFTRAYIDCALWSESDESYNFKVKCEDEGYTVHQSGDKWAFAPADVDAATQPHEYDYQYAAWQAAWEDMGGGNDDTSLEMQNFDADDIGADSLAEIIADCLDFQKANESDLAAYYEKFSVDYAGHDFWLTRNGHGAGFWDRGAGDIGDRLSEACKPYGSASLYVGDDGKIYVQ